MPHLSIIKVNKTPWTDATIKSIDLINNADVVISETLVHPVLKTFVSPQSRCIKFDDLDKQEKKQQLFTTGNLQIVCVTTLDEPLDLANTIRQFSKDQTALVETKIHHVKGDLPWLSSLPSPSNTKSAGIRILIDVEQELELKRPKVHSFEYPMHTLIYHNLTGSLESVITHATGFGLPTPSQTLSSPLVKSGAQQNPPSVAEPQESQNASSRSLVYVGPPGNGNRLSDWQTSRYLLGRKLLITRAKRQQATLFRMLTDLGAHVEKLSLTRFNPITGPRQTLMYDKLSTYQWLIFTSVNAVKFFFQGLAEAGQTQTSLAHLEIACVGPTTKACLNAHGCTTSLMPETFTSEGLIEAFSKTSMQQVKVLLPRAKIARETLPLGLRNMGAALDVVDIYEKELVDTDQDTWNNLNVIKMDGVLFCASSAVRAMEKWLNEADLGEFKTTVQAFCIGPSTAATASEVGYDNVTVANESTIDGLVQSVVDFNVEQPS